jgi:hypothetical protein
VVQRDDAVAVAFIGELVSSREISRQGRSGGGAGSVGMRIASLADSWGICLFGMRRDIGA